MAEARFARGKRWGGASLRKRWEGKRQKVEGAMLAVDEMKGYVFGDAFCVERSLRENLLLFTFPLFTA
jgi:hypothetical protein